MINTWQERRRAVRRRDTYKLWCALGTKWVSAYGVDISASGLGLVMPVELEKDEVQFNASLDDVQVTFRAKKVWAQPGTFRGQIVHRYGLRITGIDADGWEALVRYCNAQNPPEGTEQFTRLQPDDVARLIPYTVQHRMLGILVERKRLAPLDGNTPLVQYAYGGKTDRDGAPMHRVNVHSRIFDRDAMETRAFDTRFVYAEDQSVLTLDE
ncbi:MAG TPA: PilZ domain-containing protein [Candidatus Baltobacteraceae bacterium]